MNRIKFIYFDVGGVVIEYEHAYKTIAERTGKTYAEIGEIIDTYAVKDQSDTEQLLKDYDRELGVTFASYEDFINYYTGAFLPIQPTHDLIKEQVGKYALGLFSNTEPDTLETSIKLGKIPDVPYKAIVASCYVGYRKPAKEIYAIAQEKAGVPAKNILFIDDSQINVDATKALGWHALYFNKQDYKKSVEEIRTYLSSH